MIGSSCDHASRHAGTTDWLEKVGDSYVIVGNVPCEVCDDCGERFFRASVSRKMEEIVRRVGASARVSIVDFTNSSVVEALSA